MALSSCPMFVVGGNKEILWVNQSFELVLGYTAEELLNLHIEALTHDAEEWDMDTKMMATLVKGYRLEYHVRKQLRKKSGEPVTALIHVLRWPPYGDVECFLITAIPVSHAADFVVGEVTSLRVMLAEFIHNKTSSTSDKLLNWAKDHPIWASIMAFVLGYLLLGDRIVEVAEHAKRIFYGP